ncbi:MAG: UDP-N-acetylmuramoyl-L-alanine--D-glutamate ligase [Dehalococcoidia bacterium]|nr:UDP-N-acetylmuramoyl-L-alanine--D-glutamate ligase [Dehalococcoidia bacterium]
MTLNQDWQGKRITVIGLGIEGEDLARYFATHGASVTVSDMKPRAALAARAEALEALGVTLHLGANDPAYVANADIVCVSQSVPLTNPLVIEARRRGVPVESMTSLFLEMYPGPILGITGSSGKTTTTSLVDAIFTAANRGHVFGGNVGIGALSLLDAVQGPQRTEQKSMPGGSATGIVPEANDISEPRPMPRPSGRGAAPQNAARGVGAGEEVGRTPLSDQSRDSEPPWAVLEISHTQLVLTKRSPNVAALLNVTPNHLDQFSWDEYVDLKRKIYSLQSQEDAAVFNADDPVSRDLRPEARGRVFLFSVEGDHDTDGAFLRDGTIFWRRDGRTEPVLPAAEVPLRGFHNVANATAATAIAAACNIAPEAVAAAIRAFRAPPHRLEFVARVRDVDYYNDSIATAPERTLAALRSFDQPIVLLLGGRDKKLPLEDLVAEAKRRCRAIICFGESGALFAAACQDGGIPIESVATLAQAVEAAARRAQPGDIVLLSPACTSFDAYANFEQRGTDFRRLVGLLGSGAGVSGVRDAGAQGRTPPISPSPPVERGTGGEAV